MQDVAPVLLEAAKETVQQMKDTAQQQAPHQVEELTSAGQDKAATSQ